MKEEITNMIMGKLISNNLSTNDSGKTPFSVSISATSKFFCVGIIDMANSTKISAKLSPSKSSTYYEIFLNHMAGIINKFGGLMVKNIGDSLLFCSLETNDPKRKFGFLNFLECLLKMIDDHKYLEIIYNEQGLPTVNYRITSDFGSMSIMKANNFSIDLIGTPVNICSKIKQYCPINGIVIGGDLYEIVKDFEDYNFKKTSSFSAGLKQSYPLYVVKRNLSR